MLDFVAHFMHRNDHKVSDAMFDRAYDRPLAEYIIDTCRNLEVIPAITLEETRLVTDQLQIRSEVNKQTAKDPRIKNNRALERLAQPNKTLYDMLYLTFRIQAKDRDVHVVRKVRIPKTVHGGYYVRNGKKVRVLNQVVDNSTFVKKNVLNFKTKLYPIKLSTGRMKLKFIDGETATCPFFRLDLLSKVTNPLIYYLAQYGIRHTIEMFRLEDVMCVVDTPLDEDNYLYLPITEGLYLEVNAKAFYVHEFVGTFTATMYDVLKDDPDITFRDAFDQEYWYGRLSEIFSKKRYASKALRILISFNKIMDTSVKKQLIIGKRRKRNTFTIILWMMTNYRELLKKDSHDLRFKRVRANETLAYYFDKHISHNVYSLLNTDNPTFEKYIRLLNSINEYTLLRGASGGGKSSTTSMFRYERYNDFDAIEISRYTLKGPTGINGGKDRTSLNYRDIYTSHLGRFDMNVCSSSDPGLTGYLCANVKLDHTGYFDTTGSEPDTYDMSIDSAVAKAAVPGYNENREDYLEMQLNRDEDGFIVLRRKPSSKEIQRMLVEHPEEHGLYRTDDGLRIIPRSENVDAKGFKILSRRKTGRDADKVERDTEGFVVLTRIVTRMSVRDKEEE